MKSSLKSIVPTVFISGALMAGFALASAGSDEFRPGTPPAEAASPSEDDLLSAVVNSKLTGLSRLQLGGRSKIRQDADHYIAFRRGKKSDAQRKKWKAECQAAAGANVFCRTQDLADSPADARDLRGKARKKPRAGRTEADQAWVAIAAGDVDGALSSSESAIFQAFRKADSIEKLQKITDKVVGLSSCEAIPLNTMLAQKMEEFLPAEAARTQVVKVYEHAASCEKPSEWSARAKYRLSLLLIAKNEWQKAEKWLEQLSQDKNTDYFSRSIYWKARAAKSRGDQLGFEQARAKLTREFPIHYHSLLLSGKRSFNSAQNLHFPEPFVKLESKVLGDRWNTRVRAIEVLQEKGVGDYSRGLFEELEELVDQVEPEARLYLAVLQQRNNNSIGAFRALSSLFRDHPEMLSRQTLGLFFPLSKQHRQILYSVAGGGLDPYIIAALIRQESGFIPTARSPVGALGLMQLMPATARLLDRVSKRELLDGRTNVRVGVKYFRQLVNRFNGKVDMALASYNAGPMRVAEWQERYQVEDPVLFVDLIPFRETREYVSLISRNYYWYLQIYARHIFDERLEASKAVSKTERKSSVALADSTARTPASSNLPLEFSLFSAH